jgi:hypothetical protein
MEHKIYQEIFHRLNKDFDDDLKNFTVEVVSGEEILEKAVEYFTSDKLGWIYPSKSYVVAICYAKWISKIWGYEFYDMLNDQDLLYGNDPYFKSYSEDKATYNKILEVVGLDFDETKGIIPDVKRYFESEFMLGEDK